MKNSKSKKLSKNLETICDFNKVCSQARLGETTPVETDPTTATVTIMLTTVVTHQAGKMLI